MFIKPYYTNNAIYPEVSELPKSPKSPIQALNREYSLVLPYWALKSKVSFKCDITIPNKNDADLVGIDEEKIANYKQGDVINKIGINTETGLKEEIRKFPDITLNKMKDNIQAQIEKVNINFKVLDKYINVDEHEKAAEIFCQAIRELGSEQKMLMKERRNQEPEECRKLQIILRKFLLHNLGGLKDPANINLVLNTVTEVGLPENEENAEIIENIIPHVGHPETKISSLKALECIGQKNNNAEERLAAKLSSFEKYTAKKAPEKTVIDHLYTSRALAVVGKGETKTTNVLLITIQKAFVASHGNDIPHFKYLQYQLLESLYIANKEKFNELKKSLISNETSPYKYGIPNQVFDIMENMRSNGGLSRIQKQIENNNIKDVINEILYVKTLLNRKYGAKKINLINQIIENLTKVK